MFNTRLAGFYGSLSLYNSILHNVFLLYHVETFVSVYRIDKTSFWIGETIFLIWNSLNDPLFGWLSDRGLLSGTTSTEDIVLNRMKALSWAGPLFALSFLSFWFSWTYPSLQFVICLCLYDGFLTMVDLHHSALLADLVVSTDTRTRLNSYCSVFSCLGSASVFLSYFFWDRESMHSFRTLCIVLCLASLIGYFLNTRYMISAYKQFSKKQTSSAPVRTIKDKDYATEERKTLKKYVRDLAGHRNFVVFAIMNLVQVFHCHFNSNFFPLFLENLLGDSISQTTCSIILGVSFIAPHINNLYFLTLCRRFGVYSVIRGLFVFKFIISVLMLVLGHGHVYLLCIYIASNRVFTEGTCKLLNLVISDLVDEDLVLHGREQPVSALMFGTAALVSKPGQTLAPLIGTWLLALQTGHDVFDSGNDLGSLKLSLSNLDEAERTSYQLGVFQLLVYVPITCALIQLAAWSRFDLRGKKLQWIKSVRAGTSYLFV